MLPATGKRIKNTLYVCACLLFVRFTIYLTASSLQDVYIFTGYLVAGIVLIALLYFIITTYLFCIKMLRLPGPEWRKLIHFVIGFNKFQTLQAKPPAVLANKYLQSLSSLADEDDHAHLCAGFSFMFPAVMVTSPESIKQVLNHPHTQFKSWPYPILRFAIGNGLLTSSGDRWLAHRKLLTPAFHFKILESLNSIVMTQAKLLTLKLESAVSKSEDRTVDNIVPFIFDSTINVLSESSMGVESASETSTDGMKDGITHWMSMMISCMSNPLLLLNCYLGWTKTAREYRKFDRTMKKYVDQIILKRMNRLKHQIDHNSNETEAEFSSTGKEKKNLIDIMIREHLRSPGTFSFQDIRHQVTTFSGAGLDTTLWSISYTLLLLGHHPEVQEKLYQEIQTYLSHSDLETLSPDKLKKLTYLNAIYNESLRLYPPIPLVVRKAEKDININGRVIPNGASIVVLLRNVHLDARYWPEPHQFKPERFLSPLADPYCFLPFSAGPRNCIAQKYANIQAKTTIIHIINKFKIQSITQLKDVETFAFPVGHTETPIKLRLHRRC